MTNGNTGGVTQDYVLSTLTAQQATVRADQLLQPTFDRAEEWLASHAGADPHDTAVQQQAAIYEDIIAGTEGLAGGVSVNQASYLIILIKAAGDVLGAAILDGVHDVAGALPL